MKYNELPVPTHSSNMFSWHKNEGRADLIDFGRAGIMGNLFNDACDRGFAVKSERTGEVRKFYLSEKVRDAEGEVTEWKLRSIGEKFVITIYND